MKWNSFVFIIDIINEFLIKFNLIKIFINISMMYTYFLVIAFEKKFYRKIKLKKKWIIFE